MALAEYSYRPAKPLNSNSLAKFAAQSGITRLLYLAGFRQLLAA